MERLAEATVDIARQVERGVFGAGRRADPLIAQALRGHRDLAPPDQRFIREAVLALFRWRGWLDPLRLRAPEAKLLAAVLLDSADVHPVCRHWARSLRREASSLLALGDAPSWAARAEGLRRLVRGQAVNTDPWHLFPPWLRGHLPLPPGDQPPRLRLAEFLRVLQTPSRVWLRAQGANPSKVWKELSEQGLRPAVDRRMTTAALLARGAEVQQLPEFVRGELEVEDIAAQAVGLVCDPDSGERWWVPCAGSGGKAIHLSALMKGKGLVVASDRDERRLSAVARHARRTPFRNLTTRVCDGRHVAGKPGTFDGVLLEPPSSAIGMWRRHPEARWLAKAGDIERLAAEQRSLLQTAATALRPGGALIYTVPTLTPTETHGSVRALLESNAAFRLDPFTNPLDGQTTDGTLLIWPQMFDSDAVFIARLVKAS